MSKTSDMNPSGEMRTGEELDASVVDAELKSRIDGLSGTPELRQFTGGSSNLTYLIRYPDRALVLRRPPFGTRPKSGHSMIREYRVMSSIAPVFPAVPKLHFHQPEEDSVLGAEFYVMDEVPGTKPGRDLPADWDLGEDGNRKLCFAFFDRLIELHAVDYRSVGLSDFGRPDGYVDRQILGWNKRYETVITDDVERYDDIRDWLEANRPTGDQSAGGASILHGDYRLDNTILDANDPFNIVAVLDWEISALGDPLMDLGNTLAYWLEATDPAGVVEYRMQPSTAPGMPARAEILAYYGERTGRSVAGFDFYLVAGVWRLAVILQQIYYRYYNGQSSNEKFANFGKRVNALAAWCRMLIEQAE